MYRVKEFAALVGKSSSTLRRWDREGRLKPRRSPGNQRYYTDADLQKALNIETKTQSGLERAIALLREQYALGTVEVKILRSQRTA